MRIIDLIALTADLNKNAALEALGGETVYNVTGISPAEDEDGVVLTTKLPPAKPLRHWEFALLAGRPEIRGQRVRLQAGDAVLPIYGCSFHGGKIVLH